jgi:hypothetical protein
MTRVWSIHDRYPEGLIGVYDSDANPDRLVLKRGCPVDVGSSPLAFTFQAKASRLRRIDDLASTAMVPLVSHRLAALLEQLASSDVQLLPARIHAKDGVIEDYRVANATSAVSAVDLQRSKFSLVHGTDRIMSFKVLVLVDRCLGEHALARCAEYHSFLLASDALANAMEEGGMTGMQLARPDEV